MIWNLKGKKHSQKWLHGSSKKNSVIPSSSLACLLQPGILLGRVKLFQAVSIYMHATFLYMQEAWGISCSFDLQQRRKLTFSVKMNVYLALMRAKINSPQKWRQMHKKDEKGAHRGKKNRRKNLHAALLYTTYLQALFYCLIHKLPHFTSTTGKIWTTSSQVAMWMKLKWEYHEQSKSCLWSKILLDTWVKQFFQSKVQEPVMHMDDLSQIKC